MLFLAVAVTIPLITKSRPNGINSRAAFSSNSSATVNYVRVRGDVRHPGIYPINDKSMTADVIKLAEPLTNPKTFLPKGIETSAIKNGSDISFELRNDNSAFVTSGSLPVKQRLVLGIPLNINLMTEADFDLIPGIGPVLAKRIIEYRRNNGGSMTVRDLLQVEGIGDKKFLALSRYF